MSKSAAYDYLSALREAGVVETTGAGRAIKWRLVGATSAAAQPQPYTTIEALAQAVHDGLVDATDEQREVLEQVWQIAHADPAALSRWSGRSDETVPGLRRVTPDRSRRSFAGSRSAARLARCHGERFRTIARPSPLEVTSP